ncbi:hypothetical protein JNUCC0626_32305 [Lentzea sp. JNUCC 0626]|uniref:hypothetical protein n=1 Tax=Lentzea sp. JNUCC 0626 TaxID=3367513 RepID=UPI00374A7A9C
MQPQQLAGVDVTAFNPADQTHTLTVRAELLQHGPDVRPATAPLDTHWEARIMLPNDTVSGTGDSTWAALLNAREQLEGRHGLLLAIAAARPEYTVENIERRRGVTTVTSLQGGPTAGMLTSVEPDLVSGTVHQLQVHAQLMNHDSVSAPQQ